MSLKVDQFNTPGQLIEARLVEREWAKKTLALVIGIDEAVLNRVITGKRPLTAELAIALEEVLGGAADDYLQLQNKFELAQARLSVTPNPARKQRMNLFGDLKVNHLIKRGWLDISDEKDVDAVASAVSKFFGKPATEVVADFKGFAAKKTDANNDASLIQIAWMCRVRQLAKDIKAPTYSNEKLRASLPALKALMETPRQIEDVPHLLNSAGVRLVVVESLPSAKIDGVCMWIENNASPVIGLSARFDRIDNFWFVLRHELEHVLNSDGKDEMLHGHMDADLTGKRAGIDDSLPEIEIKANAAASNFCVDTALMDAFFNEHNPYFSERKLVEFANELKVHPGVVAGQLHHRSQRHDRFRSHLSKVRAHLVNSTITDGWGNVPNLTTE